MHWFFHHGQVPSELLSTIEDMEQHPPGDSAALLPFKAQILHLGNVDTGAFET